MELQLLDNGIDSLNSGVAFYAEYLGRIDPEFRQNRNLEPADIANLPDSSYLKLSLICIQHAVEIFSKQILSDVNELLIYDQSKGSNSSLYEHLRATIEGNNDTSLHYRLIVSDSDIKTIGYEECIKRIKLLFGSGNEQFDFDVLDSINGYRNKITHFGLRKLDYYKIIALVNNVLGVIVDFYYPKLFKNTSIYHQDLLDIIKDVICRGTDAEIVGFYEFYNGKLERISDLLSSASGDLINGLSNIPHPMAQTLSVEDTYDTCFKVELHSADGFLYEIIKAVNEPRLDATILTDDEGKLVFAVFDYSEDSGYLYIFDKEPLLVEDVSTLDTRDWKGKGNGRKNFKNEGGIDENSISCLTEKLASYLLAKYEKDKAMSVDE